MRMQPSRQHRRVMRYGRLLACVLALGSACTTTTRHPIAGGERWQDVLLRRSTKTRVLRVGGVRSEFADVRLAGDTLYGWRSRVRGAAGDSVAIPTASLVTVEQSRPNVGLTLFAIVGGALSAAGAFYVYLLSQGGSY